MQQFRYTKQYSQDLSNTYQRTVLPGCILCYNITMLTTITTKGQITVPASIRKKLKLRQGTKVAVYMNSQGQIILNPIKNPTAEQLGGILNKKGKIKYKPLDQAMKEAVNSYVKEKLKT